MVDNNYGPQEEKEEVKYASRSDIETGKATAGQQVAVLWGNEHKKEYFPATISEIKYDDKTKKVLKITGVYLKGPRAGQLEDLNLGSISSKPAEKLEEIVKSSDKPQPQQQAPQSQFPYGQGFSPYAGMQFVPPQYLQQPQPQQPIVIYAQPPADAQQPKAKQTAKSDQEEELDETLVDKIINYADSLVEFDESTVYVYQGKMYLSEAGGDLEKVTKAHPKYQTAKAELAKQAEAIQKARQEYASAEDVSAKKPAKGNEDFYEGDTDDEDADEEDKIDFNAPPYSNITPPPYPRPAPRPQPLAYVPVPPRIAPPYKPAAKGKEDSTDDDEDR
jgi:hypothetical protein